MISKRTDPQGRHYRNTTPRKWRACAACGKPLPIWLRADAGFCSAACRQAAYRSRSNPYNCDLRTREGKSWKAFLDAHGGR